MALKISEILTTLSTITNETLVEVSEKVGASYTTKKYDLKKLTTSPLHGDEAHTEDYVKEGDPRLKIEKGACGYYAFDVSIVEEGNKQLPASETFNTIRAYGSSTSPINLDISLVGDQRVFTVINDSNCKLVVKASDEGQTVNIYPSGVKKIARIGDDVIKLASLIGIKAEDVSLLYDWNMVLETGFYRGTGMSNKPTDSGYWQYCIVMQHDPDFVVQLLFDFGSSQDGTNGVWVRWCETGAWGSWKTFALT